MFFQLELILCGKFTSISVGQYAIIQKLYSSIATSLFGSIGVLILMRSIRRGRVGFLDARLIWMALIGAACVPLVGTVVAYVGPHSGLSTDILGLSAVVAFGFTLSSFLGLQLATVRPSIGIRNFFLALLIYVGIFLLWRPKSQGELLFAAGIFFTSFVLLAWFASATGASERGEVSSEP
jgi:hypothetical protein